MKQEYFFENPHTGKPYTDIKKGWATLLKKAGIENLRFHDLGHIFATYATAQAAFFSLKRIHLVLREGDLTSVDTLSHTKITTTERYLNEMKKGKCKLVNGFNVPDIESKIIELAKKSR